VIWLFLREQLAVGYFDLAFSLRVSAFSAREMAVGYFFGSGFAGLWFSWILCQSTFPGQDQIDGQVPGEGFS
jgi:hypothetical protein